MADAVVRNKTQVIDVDLKAYFDNVRHDILLKKVAERVKDGKGRAMDNIMPACAATAAGRVERLWRTVRYEEIYLRDYENVAELKKALKTYFEFYNNDRPHQTFGGKTPSEIYWGETKQEKAA